MDMTNQWVTGNVDKYTVFQFIRQVKKKRKEKLYLPMLQIYWRRRDEGAGGTYREILHRPVLPSGKQHYSLFQREDDTSKRKGNKKINKYVPLFIDQPMTQHSNCTEHSKMMD